MEALRQIAALLVRASHLFAFTLAPPLFSPEPTAFGALDAVAGALALGAVVVAARRAWRADGKLAAALACGAVVACVAAAAWFRGPRGPLGAGIAVTFVPVWAALATTAAYAAGAAATAWRTGHDASAGAPPGRARAWRARYGAAGLVAALALGVLGASWSFVHARDALWRNALRRDGEHEAALAALTNRPIAERRFDAAAAVVEACLEVHAASCACLVKRAEIDLRAHLASSAAHAHHAFDTCKSATARAVWAEALANGGDSAGAAREATRALEGGGPGARLHFVLASALAAQGDPARAIAEAEKSVALGGGRDEALNLAALAIAANDLDKAKPVLEALVAKDPTDAAAAYDLALIADRRERYDDARSGYLAAIHADPKLADARFNLALLTLRRGAIAEAVHHARVFAEAFPSDPRGQGLVGTVAAAVPQPKREAPPPEESP